jgi:hypothetical protein
MIPSNKLPFFIIVLALLLGTTPTEAGNCREGCDIGPGNTFLGAGALESNTTGFDNTAIGDAALIRNSTGSENTAIGLDALEFNTTASNNTASGSGALFVNTTGSDNTASGANALESNTTGDNNTANGFQALESNGTGSNNLANGVNALEANTTGSFNAVNGVGALKVNTIGNNNTADGYRALFNNTTGSLNIALGSEAGLNLTTGNNNIDIGNGGVAAESNTIRIGTSQSRCFIAGIYGTLPTANTPTQVYIDSTGQLGAKPSSQRFKHDIKPMDKASEAILSLKPVAFHYKSDQTNSAQFGLIAEEVEKVNPDLVARDKEGKAYTVRYDEVNAMLLNEFLKAHKKIAEQADEIEQLKSALKAVTARIDAKGL